MGSGWGMAAFLALCAGAGAQTVRITWIGQACFVVQAEGGPTVITDPPAANVGFPLPSTPAEVTFVTHNHGDHNNTAGVRGSPTVVDGRPVTARAEMTAAGLPFVLIPGFHDNTNGSTRGANTIIRWNQGGLRFAHFGDYGQDELSEAQLADLRDLDVAFLPAGGFFTIDAAKVAELVSRQLRPRVAILMHYRSPLGGPAQLATFPAVAAPFATAVNKPATVEIRRETLPASTEAWVFEVASDAAVVNAASFTAGAPVAPGALASVFGSFSGAQTAIAGSLPLPRLLGETEVRVAGTPVPLIYASPSQVNFQVPSGLGTSQSEVEVRAGGQRVGRASLTVIPRAPGLFVAANQDGRLNSASNPARRGQILVLYATGQGAVTPAVEDGVAAPAGPLAVTAQTPEVTVGARRAAVRFSGLAPGFVGLWQINIETPAEAPLGASVPVVVVHGGTSNVLPVAIQ